MLNVIFQQIYEISLLNLYIYTDCGVLFRICPHEKLQCYSLGTKIDKKIHLIDFNDMLSSDRITDEQKESGFPLWQKQLEENVKKIGHIYLDSLYKPFCILFTKKITLFM